MKSACSLESREESLHQMTLNISADTHVQVESRGLPPEELTGSCCGRSGEAFHRPVLSLAKKERRTFLSFFLSFFLFLKPCFHLPNSPSLYQAQMRGPPDSKPPSRHPGQPCNLSWDGAHLRARCVDTYVGAA